MQEENQVISFSELSVKSFQFALKYLSRSSHELLYDVHSNTVSFLITPGHKAKVLYVFSNDSDVFIKFPEHFSEEEIDQSKKYLRHLFGVTSGLKDFYVNMSEDQDFGSQVNRFKGLRVVGINDLFEALSWAIIGQQVNLPFAYKVKRRIIEQYGEVRTYAGQAYYLFPQPDVILRAGDQELKALQLSRQKIRYIRLVAQKLAKGEWEKSKLERLSSAELKAELSSVTGIGDWSANYVMLRCFHRYDAFPQGDAGLHKAIRRTLGLREKPSKQLLNDLRTAWHPWEGLMTFYLWFSLLNED